MGHDDFFEVDLLAWVAAWVSGVDLWVLEKK
jgi:hypothetical protein